MTTAITPAAWVIDDTGFPKFGRYSVGVAPQYCGALGKVANCQVGVSVHAATDQASCPINWRLFLPEEWDHDAQRRRKAHVPQGERHRPKWQLALDMLDELASWELAPPVVLADAAYGEVNEFRLGLEQRELAYVVQAPGTISAYPEEVVPETLPYPGRGQPSKPRYRQPRASVKRLVLAAGEQAAHTVTWRQGAACLAVCRPAGASGWAAVAPGGPRWGVAAALAAGRVAPGRARAGQVLAGQPARRGRAGAAGPSGQVALAGGARLSRAQGRVGVGPLRGALLAGLAPSRDAGVGRPCVRALGAAGPKSPCVGLTTFQVLRELQLLVAGWAGACPLCLRRLPRSTAWLHPSATPT